ncbi:MAG: hypothetical protein WDO19_21440 [Bacteroidota bacterium]
MIRREVLKFNYHFFTGLPSYRHGIAFKTAQVNCEWNPVECNLACPAGGA